MQIENILDAFTFHLKLTYILYKETHKKMHIVRINRIKQDKHHCLKKEKEKNLCNTCCGTDFNASLKIGSFRRKNA